MKILSKMKQDHRHRKSHDLRGTSIQTISLLIAFLVCMTVFAGCKNNSKTSSTADSNGSAATTVNGSDSQPENTISGGDSSDSSVSGTSSVAGSTNGSTSGSNVTSLSTGSASKMPTPASRFKDLKGRKIKLFIWGYTEVYAKSAAWQPMAKRIAEVEKKFNCDFVVVAGPTETDFNPIWQSTLAGQPIVDIVDTAGPHTLANPIKSGLYMDLNQFSVFDWRQTKWDKPFLKITNFGGKQYVCGAVLEGPEKLLLNQAMFFNKRLVKEAGYNPDDIYKWEKAGTWTWAKFKEIAEKISKLDPGNVWGTVGNDKLLYANLVLSNGTNYILKTATGVSFNAGDPKALEAAEFYKELYQKHIMPETDAFSDAQMFTSCKVGFMSDYLERLRYPETYGKMVDDYGVVVMPKGPKATDYVSGVDWFGGYAIPTGTKNAQDVALVIDYLTDSRYASSAEANKAMNTARESYVRDEQSLYAFDMITTRTVMSPTWLSEPVRSDWLKRLDSIKKGEITAADAVAQNKDNYATTLKDVWAIK